MLRFAVLIAFAFAVQAGAQDAVPYPAEDFSEDTACPIEKVVDGDTVVIQRDGESVSVRLIGVDTPETMHPQKAAEAFGKEASAFARNLLLGESVYLRGDEREDRNGRLLAYLYRVSRARRPVCQSRDCPSRLWSHLDALPAPTHGAIPTLRAPSTGSRKGIVGPTSKRARRPRGSSYGLWHPNREKVPPGRMPVVTQKQDSSFIDRGQEALLALLRL